MNPGVYQLTDYKAPELPDLLKGLPGWLLWRFQQKPGQVKPAKIPYYINGKVRSGVHGVAEDRQQMSTYQRAFAACLAGGFSGVGLAIYPEFQVVALDFDNCVNTSGEIEVPWIAELATVTYTEYSPSGRGIRAFMRGSLPSRKDTQPKDGGFAVEIFGDAGYVTVTGNTTAECQMWGLEKTVADLTDEVKQLFTERFGNVSRARVVEVVDGADDVETWMMSAAAEPKAGWTQEQAREYLFDCPASTNRDTWLKLLMALHYETEGAEWALELAVEWSRTGDNFVSRRDVEGRWKSFRRSENQVITGAWLMAHRKECMTQKKYQSVDTWREKIKAGKTEMELREVVAKQVSRDTSLTDIERHNLAVAFQVALKDVAGVRYPISMCREMVAQPKVTNDYERQTPDWLDGWVYVTSIDKYYHIQTGDELSVQGFNSKYNKFMPRDEAGNVTTTAHHEATCNFAVETVRRVMYMPGCDPLFKLDGSEYANGYLPGKVPAAAESITPEGQKAIDTILWHIRHMIANGRDDIANLVLSWMSFNVRNPGKKVRWAPLIKGIEGDGKSLLGNLMGAMMGTSNVRTIGPSVISSDFNNWAEGVCVGVLEEVRMVGHNRYDILNKLKPFITNNTIEMHLKGRGTYEAINTVNYIALTNYADAIPVSETDRRWFVIFTPFNETKIMREFLESRGGYKDYFNNLVDAINNHASDFKRYLLDYELSADFDPNGVAPETAEKATMRNSGMSEEELLIRELIESGTEGVNEHVILSNCLTNAWAVLDTDIEMPRTRGLAIALMRMGYTKVDKRVKYDDRKQTLWVKSQDVLDGQRWRVLTKRLKPSAT